MARKRFRNKRRRLSRRSRRRGSRHPGRRSKGSATTVKIPNRGMAGRMLVKMTYSRTTSLATEGVAQQITGLTYRVNSINDPEVGGHPDQHRPRGYQEYTQFYQHYRVYGAHVQLKFSLHPGQGGQESDNIFCTLEGISSAETATGNATDFKERQRGNRFAKSAVLTSQFPSKILSQFYSVAALEGITRDRMKNNDKYGAHAGEDPPLQPTVISGIANLTSTTPVSVDLTFQIIYYVVLTEPLKINRSPLPVVIQPDTTDLAFVSSSQ